MRTWPVLVEGWQQECCGDAFGVGDTVAWALVLSVGEYEGWGWPEEMRVELKPIGRRSAQLDRGAIDIVRSAEGPEVAVDRSAGRDAGTLRGTLIEEHHGRAPTQLEETVGTVRRLRIVSQRFRLADREWRPLPGAVRVRDTERVPRAFSRGDRRSRREAWIELGALVDLELAKP